MKQPKKVYRINEVAEILGVPKRTLHSWERAGKIPKAKRDAVSKYRLYTGEDVEKLKRITGRPL